MGEKLPPNEMELYQRTDEVLHYLWDPIGVARAPQARDEYYAYLPKVFTLLKEDADKQKIVDYLSGVVKDSMGMKPNVEHDQQVADILLEWREFIFSKEERGLIG